MVISVSDASIRVSSVKVLLTLQELFTGTVLTSVCVYTCPYKYEDSGNMFLEDAKLKWRLSVLVSQYYCNPPDLH